ncbi:uncharacterized protein LOC126848583 [Cataglyphis hispanica]|uniref:uncharacterized protein LOC126848583 n=1 Tax=Cataglyphis hispanica TaxID=1086592 RepID=UPI00217FB5DE|nr:uncharacterized protein LOC126848583 [Cataglyphis hispanica]
MPGIASATGLLSARIRPVRRPKPKSVELSGCTKTAPFVLRPFAGLFNPYPYGCSVLCNHPADCEAKEVVRRAKDTWATEGKALLLPEEMEMIRTSLLAMGAGGNRGEMMTGNVGGDTGDGYNTEMIASAVPEELFRKYTETDSRPLTPAPTLASGPTILTSHATQEDLPVTCNPRERTTLVLDLRTNSQNQQVENETFSWHALTLELPPMPRKSEIFVCKPVSRSQHLSAVPAPPPPSPHSPIAEKCETNSSKNMEEKADSGSEQQPVIVRRRGKRLRKRKCRRGSTYGQQTEVRDPLEPTVTQVSQIGNGSRRSSVHINIDNVDDSISSKKTPLHTMSHTMPPSFLTPDILKHLCRELDRDKVEAEFSIKKRIALEEALRVKGDAYSTLRGSRQTSASLLMQNAPRLFSRQAVRFELLDSQSLLGLTPLQYLSKYTYITSGRKLIFGRIFNRFNDETLNNVRRISSSSVEEALQEVIGKVLTDEQRSYLKSVIGEITDSLDFREWCGLCAAVERLLCPLPSKTSDPPAWLEKVDFEALERRLKSAESVDTTLALLLKEIRDR